MDHTGRDSPGDNTLTVYEIAIEEVRDASFNLARALLARALNGGDATATEKRVRRRSVGLRQDDSPIFEDVARRCTAHLTPQGARAPQVEP